MKDRPRNRLIVPIVTTIEGRPSPVIKRPLTAPQTRPVPRPTTTSIGVSAPMVTASPMAVDDSAMIEATERSISPEMITSAMANAISAFSVKLKRRVGEVPRIEEIGRGKRVDGKDQDRHDQQQAFPAFQRTAAPALQPVRNDPR